MTIAKLQFREKLKAFAEEHFNLEFDALSPMQRSQALGLCYFTEILARSRPGSVPDSADEYDEAYTDTANDQSVDFFVYGDDGHHFIVQTKYRGQKSKVEQDHDVAYFKDVIRRLHPETGKEYSKNDFLLSAIANVNWREDKFELLFITTGRGSDDIKTLEKEPLQEIDHPHLSDIDDRVTFRFLDQSTLNEEYRAVETSLQEIEVNLRVKADPHGTLWYQYEAEDDLKAYITTLDIAQIFELDKQHGARLCNLNIRNWIGDNSTNKGIVKSAINTPDKFFFFNNGLSAVAQEVIPNESNSELRCVGFSIINGAQTVRSMAKAYRSMEGQAKEEVKRTSVMIRITQDPDLRKNADLTADITRYNNTQNSVKISDFRSNDPIQIFLNKSFSKLSRSGKKYNYQNKRAQSSKRNVINIKLEDFCKTIHSFRFGPVDFFGGVPYLFDDNPDKGYFRLFADPTSNSIASTFSDAEFKEISTYFFVCEAIRTAFETTKKEKLKKASAAEVDGEVKEANVRRALQGRYLIFYVTQLILTEFAKLRSQNLLEFFYSRKMDDPQWQTEGVNEKLMKQCVGFACDQLISDYESESRSSHFIHRNYHRQQSTLERLQSRISVDNSTTVQLFSEKW